MGSWWWSAPSWRSAAIAGMSCGCRLAMPQLLLHSALPCRNQHICIKVGSLLRQSVLIDPAIAFLMRESHFLFLKEIVYFKSLVVCALYCSEAEKICSSLLSRKNRKQCVFGYPHVHMPSRHFGLYFEFFKMQDAVRMMHATVQKVLHIKACSG